MIVRVFIISLFVVSSSLMGMKNVLSNKSEYTEIDLGTINNTKSITSLESWKAFAKDNELLGDHTVSPTAAAEFQQKDQIQTDLPILPEALAVWSNEQWTQEYTAEVERMHALLRHGEDVQKELELPLLKNLCIKKAYAQLVHKEKALTSEQEWFVCKRKCAIALPIVAIVFGIALILEMVFYVPCR